MVASVLHALSQRPSLTGSGVTLDALVRHAAESGWTQTAIVGAPSTDRHPQVANLATEQVFPLLFGKDPLDFPLPGMSDVMPYESSRFSQLTPAQIELYQQAWKHHLASVIEDFRPQVIHSHHLWLMSALIKDVAPTIPVVTHCHATGLRQLRLCPHLSERVRRGVSRNDRFVVLHRGQVQELADAVGIPTSRVSVVGAGYREDLFLAPESTAGDDFRRYELLYAGKLSAAKGLPQLLDALEALAKNHPSVRLHVAGGGAGAEAEKLGKRMRSMEGLVVVHGPVDQTRLAELMRHCSTFILPSFYEGLPLVLVEALACGCRLVSTALPVVTQELAPSLGPALECVALPRMVGPDTPYEKDLPRFISDLTTKIEMTLARPSLGNPRTLLPGVLEQFTWGAVFRRIEVLWLQLLEM